MIVTPFQPPGVEAAAEPCIVIPAGPPLMSELVTATPAVYRVAVVLEKWTTPTGFAVAFVAVVIVRIRLLIVTPSALVTVIAGEAPPAMVDCPVP